MCLALCLTSMPANAADEMANTLVYAGENEDTINPLLNNHQELPTIIFSGLMKYDAKGQPVPELAESFTYDKGTHTYAFKLRDGVLMCPICGAPREMFERVELRSADQRQDAGLIHHQQLRGHQVDHGA
jgi:hypothetical protein